MLHAEIQWLASGPTLKLEGELVADWAEQASSLVTKDVLPEGLIVDLTQVSYIDAVGARLLEWLASVGTRFVAGNLYAVTVCNGMGLPHAQRISRRSKQPYGNSEDRSSITHSHQVEII